MPEITTIVANKYLKNQGFGKKFARQIFFVRNWSNIYTHKTRPSFKPSSFHGFKLSMQPVIYILQRRKQFSCFGPSPLASGIKKRKQLKVICKHHQIFFLMVVFGKYFLKRILELNICGTSILDRIV